MRSKNPMRSRRTSGICPKKGIAPVPPLPLEPVIQCVALGKRFGDAIAARGVDLHVAAGEVVGLLGANGAGKTTTLRMLAAVSTPDEGRAAIAGFDTLTHPLEAKARLGFLTG